MKMQVVVVLASIGFAPSPVAAQGHGGGSAGIRLTPSVDCTYLYANDEARRYWLRALILWREPAAVPTPSPPTEEELATARSTFRQLRDAAEDSGRTFAGGVQRGIVRHASWTPVALWVAGQRFALPADDSALVVVVDLPEAPGGSTRVVKTSFVPASVPPDFWPQMMNRGDTMLFYQAPRQRTTELLLSHLRANSVLRDLLR
jgi:hypothetical protein